MAHGNQYGVNKISVSLTAICPPCGKRRLHEFGSDGKLKCSQGHPAQEYTLLAHDLESTVMQHVSKTDEVTVQS